MKIHSIIIIFLLLPFSIFGQKELSREQVSEDYTIFKEILTIGHPSMYEYTSETEWDSIFNSFEQKVIKGVKTSNDLFKSISYLADNVKDGHLNILHPKIDTLPAMFPLLLKIIDGKLYTDTDDYGIPVGSEIMSIDSTSSQTILKDLLKYAPSDGYNLTKKYRQIEKVSLEYFKTNQIKSSIGILYPKNGMSSACGKKMIIPIAIILRILLYKFMLN
ncbi:hypothetical protein N9L94_07120 [Robiginitalea sp.]|nr:hypothetical protein [Robiginitalea sp.]